LSTLSTTQHDLLFEPKPTDSFGERRAELQQQLDLLQHRLDGAEKALLKARKNRSAAISGSLGRLLSPADLNSNANANTNAEIRTDRKERTALEKEVSKAHKDLVAKEELLMARETQLDDLTREISNLKTVLDMAAETNKSLRDEKSDLATFVRGELDRTEGEKRALETRCARYQEEILQNLKELGEVKVRALRELGEVRMEFHKEKKALREQHSLERKAKEEAQARCLELEHRCKELEAWQKQQQQQQQQQKEDEKNKNKNSSNNNNQNNTEKKAREAAEARCRELEDLLKASQEKNHELAALMRQKTSKIRSMDQSLDEMEELREKVFQYDQAIGRCEQLEKEVSDTSASNRELHEENASLRKEIADLNAGVFDAELEVRIKADELESAQKQLESLTSRSSSLESELTKLRAIRSDVTAENESLKEQIERLTRANRRSEHGDSTDTHSAAAVSRNAPEHVAKLQHPLSEETANKIETEIEPVESSSTRSKSRMGNGSIPTGGKENTGANESQPHRGSLKDRIGKFQTSASKNEGVPSGFQTIGLATLGLKSVLRESTRKKDDATSKHESDDENSETSILDDDDDDDDDDNCIRVIGPDLDLIRIPLDTDDEDCPGNKRVGALKSIIAEATGFSPEDLRLGLHSDEVDAEEMDNMPLDDDDTVSPGDIVVVLPSTVLVHRDGGDSNLELSVFPGTIVGNIKDYITEHTGTAQQSQRLYNLDGDMNKELGDDEPIAMDCTLRLSVC